MVKRYIGVIFVYLFAQLSPLLVSKILISNELDLTSHNNIVMNWQVLSFLVALFVSIILLHKTEEPFNDRNFASPVMTFVWIVIGFFMAIFGQALANIIYASIFGELEQSQNTVEIMQIARAYPIFIIVVAIVGPILEEFIFRKIIFGEIFKRSNFWIAGIISGLIFAVVHNDFTHLHIYFVMSFVFAFVYVKSKRIIVPVMAHVLMNTFVVIVQLTFPAELLEQVNFIQMILIGG
ncbi:type II CAAX endopeptidase family protein [Amphibacillus indicireducens]|uniref:CPBP family intramembrane metalloprotease n=1 Tax=Amphibacillus indicireducens TaxID=1076330 RepID=A0ABP7VTV9_9BACI